MGLFKLWITSALILEVQLWGQLTALKRPLKPCPKYTQKGFGVGFLWIFPQTCPSYTPILPRPQSNSWAVEPLMKLKELALAHWDPRSWGLHGLVQNRSILSVHVGVNLGKLEECLPNMCPPMIYSWISMHNKYFRKLHQTKNTSETSICYHYPPTS